MTHMAEPREKTAGARGPHRPESVADDQQQQQQQQQGELVVRVLLSSDPSSKFGRKLLRGFHQVCSTGHEAALCTIADLQLDRAGQRGVPYSHQLSVLAAAQKVTNITIGSGQIAGLLSSALAQQQQQQQAGVPATELQRPIVKIVTVMGQLPKQGMQQLMQLLDILPYTQHLEFLNLRDLQAGQVWGSVPNQPQQPGAQAPSSAGASEEAASSAAPSSSTHSNKTLSSSRSSSSSTYPGGAQSPSSSGGWRSSCHMLWADTGSTCRSLRGITYQVSALRPLLEALRGLRKLSLADVGLETLPLYVGQLQPLEELSLMGVKGLGDPTVQAAVAGLSNLRKLRMQWCSEDSSGKQAYNLPTSFLGLTQMQSLDFSYTDITSNTVELLPLFKQLKEVNLMYCHLPATLLVNTIQQLTGLTSLDLSCTRISSLPEQITSFTNLRKLSWSYLEPSTYPQEPSTTPLQLDTVWRLKSLRYLHITDNTITCLPAGLGQLTGLTCLLCCAHLLVDPPGILSCLVNLEELYLFFSSLPTLPESLTTLTRLTRVHVPQTAPMVVPPVVQAFLDARQTC